MGGGSRIPGIGRSGMLVAGLLAAAILVTACAGAPAPPEVLVLGVIPADEVDELVVDADRLAGLLSVELGVPVVSRIADNPDVLVAGMRAGQIDVGLVDPTTLVAAVDRADAVPILQAVRDGAPTHHVQWMTGDPARFCATPVVETGPDDLTFCNGTDTAGAGPVGEQALAGIGVGDPVMFVGGGSASGHRYPAAQLERMTGLDPRTGMDARFAGGQADPVLAVANGDVPVGVAVDDARTEVLEDEPDIGSRVTVFAWSAEIPNDLLVVRGGLPDEFRARVATAVSFLVRTPRGAAAFDAVYAIEGLVPADPAALDGARRVADVFGDD